MFNLFKKKVQDFFSDEEKIKIQTAISEAEKRTSGEIRVFVESNCRFVDALDRAAELFYSLKMDKTIARNGVLIYIAMKDRQLAIFADEGIHQKAGEGFWKEEIKKIQRLYINAPIFSIFNLII